MLEPERQHGFVHALALDGVYASADPCTRPVFHPAEAPSDGNVAELVALLQRRVLRYLARSNARLAYDVAPGPRPSSSSSPTPATR